MVENDQMNEHETKGQSNTGKKKGWLSWIITLTSIGVFGVMVYFVIRQWKDLISFPWRLDLISLFFVFFFHSLALGATFAAWHLMIRRLGGFTDWRLDLRYYYLSTLAKRLPTSIPYIGGRLAMYGQHGVPAAAILNAVFLENLLVGVGGVLVFILFLPFYSQVPAGITLPLFIAGTGLVIISLIRPQIYVEITNWLLKRMKRQTLENLPGRKDMLIWIGIYMLPWLFSGASMYFAPRAVSNMSGLGFFDALLVLTLATLVSLLYFVIPGGLALKEVTGSALLSTWMPVSVALTLMFIFRLIHTINEIVWARVVILLPIDKK